ncbi:MULTISPECIES: hypothetical protein [Gelidibacter]|uniref:Uncharacterized protein n=1 Tax=Gelidibacter maritimus TaxID=2761487 RepID=A0A7W2M992_9FLAO|nr:MULTISPECIES: hypothetical protein [Gelidibacter]MBA6154881.1 hypothetical protein [Gelidibacter maritimus]MCK0115234.1 hypothetical protein [Gelidibacter sp. F63206]
MNTISFLKLIKEELNVSLNINDIKRITSENSEKMFFLKWLTENEFIISLNFSIGTNYTFDIDNKSKSAIVIYGTVSELTENKTKIILETKYKYGLYIILIIPIIMLILRLSYGLEIPVPFFFFPIVFFVIISLIFNSEEKKLIRYFKEHLETEKITHYNTV